jgi:transposase
LRTLQLWQRIQPLLPAPPPGPRGGVPRRVPDRNRVAALVFMTCTPTPWSLLPAKDLGCGSATTCWRRFDEWAKAGVFEQLQALLLESGICPRIARRMIESSTRLGRHRWRIERTGAWLGGFRRLRIRYERASERFYALAMLACSVISFNALQQPPW